MTMITDPSLDLVEEILSKVPLTSLKAVKSTCKRWNTISKDESFTKKHSDKEFPAFLNFDYYCPQRRFNIHRIHYNIKGLPCIKEIGHAEHKLVAWNPYLAQTRWIELRNKRSVNKRRGLGRCAIGYDNNKNHKVLVRFFDVYDNDIIDVKHEIYNFKSSSWRGLDIIDPKRIRERGSPGAVEVPLGPALFQGKERPFSVQVRLRGGTEVLAMIAFFRLSPIGLLAILLFVLDFVVLRFAAGFAEAISISAADLSSRGFR
ncbi:hypothetical protein Bca52824_028646 [Brassica carinata]|uniref:F-box domain-containing protein n=1 Tax=Brassica carinata TaxID=52824 RepID=A0A8X7VCK4_BRACI|nr:hypothetical protein Bca52824_028646 [Brassica carinata]